MTPKATPAYSKLVGVPYSELDCWGVVREFYRLVMGIGLRHYYDHVPNDDRVAEGLVFSHRGDFKEVDKPEFGDIILIKLHGIECHIGVYLGEGKLLHTMRGSGCVIDNVARWKKMISGYYRAGR